MSTQTLSYAREATTSTFGDTKVTLFNEAAFQRMDEYISGPPPLATKFEEGPSFKKTAEPIISSGKLESSYKFKDVTPHIGRE